MKPTPKPANPVSALTRQNLSITVGFTAFAGYLVGHGGFALAALWTFVGVALLSAGASAFNQLQEQTFDAAMERTRSRPLPAKRLSPTVALLLGAAFSLLGMAVLFVGTTPWAAVAGLANLIWYNIVYTPLKRSTRFAIWIGAISGAIPPLIGFAAAGTEFEPRWLVVCLFMYTWQIPHFLMLLGKYGAEYVGAGFLVPVSVEKQTDILWTSFLWLLGAVGVTLFFPVVHLISSPGLRVVLGVCDAYVVWYFYGVVRRSPRFSRGSFLVMYLYQVCILGLMVAERLLRP